MTVELTEEDVANAERKAEKLAGSMQDRNGSDRTRDQQYRDWYTGAVVEIAFYRLLSGIADSADPLDFDPPAPKAGKCNQDGGTDVTARKGSAVRYLQVKGSDIGGAYHLYLKRSDYEPDEFDGVRQLYYRFVRRRGGKVVPVPNVFGFGRFDRKSWAPGSRKVEILGWIDRIDILDKARLERCGGGSCWVVKAEDLNPDFSGFFSLRPFDRAV